MSGNPNIVSYPVMQIRPYGLVCYDRVENHGPAYRNAGHHQLTPFKEKDAYAGLMTSHARKRLKRAIQLIVATAQPKKAMNFKLNQEFTFKLNFITLTLPGPQGNITDKEIKSKVLDVWIKAARRRFKLGSYIWRAERQKNGNLHFHLVTDVYIPYDQLRDTWNNRLNALGFIDRFEQKHGHRHPNSTDVHAIKKVRNLAAYFTKYMAKGERCAEDLYRVPYARQIWHEKLLLKPGVQYKRVHTREESRIDGKLWDCSVNLKQKHNCEMLIEGQAAEVLTKASSNPEVRQVSTDHCLILFFSPAQFKHYIRGAMLEQYRGWLASIRHQAA
jgi:hypothetical protein